jgi:hypothetical protein
VGAEVDGEVVFTTTPDAKLRVIEDNPPHGIGGPRG